MQRPPISRQCCSRWAKFVDAEQAERNGESGRRLPCQSLPQSQTGGLLLLSAGPPPAVSAELPTAPKQPFSDSYEGLRRGKKGLVLTAVEEVSCGVADGVALAVAAP